MSAATESEPDWAGVLPQSGFGRISNRIGRKPGRHQEACRIGDSLCIRCWPGLSEHTAPFDALVLLIDGEAEVTIAGVTTIVKAGEMIKVPAHQPHALKAVMRFKMLLAMIKA
jgi:mannose-6-phosphate isomerase-like protein (cupin superfamily)